MENKEQKETEQLRLELLKMNVAKMRVELYQKLSKAKQSLIPDKNG